MSNCVQIFKLNFRRYFLSFYVRFFSFLRRKSVTKLVSETFELLGQKEYVLSLFRVGYRQIEKLVINALLKRDSIALREIKTIYIEII